MDEAATPIIFYIVAIYSLGRYAGLRGGPVALVLTLLLVFADLYFVNSEDNDFTDVVFVLSLAIPPYVFGRVSRKLAEQSELLERQQALIRDQAVRDERDRIARELHDVIAHSLSAMVVQTAAAQDLVPQPPRPGRRSCWSRSPRPGREALAETGRLLHLIRDDADELGLRPAPGLADVPDAGGVVPRAAGSTVEADLDLPAAPLPGGVDVSAYRVVQEALTNALKYGDGPVRLRRRRRRRAAADLRAPTRSARHAVQRLRTRPAGHGRAGRPARRHRSSTATNGDGRLRGRRRHPAARGRRTRDPGGGRRRPGAGAVRAAARARGARAARWSGSPATAARRSTVVRRTEPDVVLMDIRMPVLDGIAATRELTAAGSPSKVLVLTTYDLDRYVYDALGAGAAGFLLKATPPDRLVEGIRTVCAGESLLAPEPDPTADRGVPPAPAARRRRAAARWRSSPTGSARCWC